MLHFVLHTIATDVFLTRTKNCNEVISTGYLQPFRPAFKRVTVVYFRCGFEKQKAFMIPFADPSRQLLSERSNQRRYNVRVGVPRMGRDKCLQAFDGEA